MNTTNSYNQFYLWLLTDSKVGVIALSHFEHGRQEARKLAALLEREIAQGNITTEEWGTIAPNPYHYESATDNAAEVVAAILKGDLQAAIEKYSVVYASHQAHWTCVPYKGRLEARAIIRDKFGL